MTKYEEVKILEDKLKEFRKTFAESKTKKQLSTIYISMNVDRYNYLKSL